MRIKKGGKTEIILMVLFGSIYVTAKLLELMLMGGYQESYRRARNRLYGGASLPTMPKSVFSDKQQFYSLLGKLKKQGLIESKKSDKGILWTITKAGLSRLMILREKRTDYKVESDNKLKIIAFDIPEKERRKREWLREVLRLLGFKMLQKSLWIGKNKIPEDFLADLRRKNLIEHIHILEVSKTGTLQELI